MIEYLEDLIDITPLDLYELGDIVNLYEPEED